MAKVLLPLIMGSYKHSGCCVCVICCFQHQGTAIRTLRNAGVTRNCVVQDRLIFVMYKAENSYNKLKADHHGHPLLQAKKKRERERERKITIPICLHEILSNRNAQTDFRTVQDSEFIG
jgi:hypothetical protein